MRGNGVTVLAWISEAAALVGGAALMTTFAGGWIAALVGLFPGWVASAALGIGVLAGGLDMALDGIPNRLAIWMSILLPSMALAVGGKLGATVRDVAHSISAAANQEMGSWLGQKSTVAIAAFGITAALLMAKRVIRKGGG